MLPLLAPIVEAVDVPVAALPVPYRTTPHEPTFQSLTDPEARVQADGLPFPVALDARTCTRYEIAAFAERRSIRRALPRAVLRRRAAPRASDGRGDRSHVRRRAGTRRT